MKTQRIRYKEVYFFEDSSTVSASDLLPNACSARLTARLRRAAVRTRYRGAGTITDMTQRKTEQSLLLALAVIGLCLVAVPRASAQGGSSATTAPSTASGTNST